ncbi:MAG: hypothetical protein MK133_10035, partial [Planctomycetes bacterium]|nr:hypothetical protein [Planctomycetota bacterium]
MPPCYYNDDLSRRLEPVQGSLRKWKAPAELPLEFSESDGIAWKGPLAGKAWSSPVIWKKQIWVTNALPDG